MRLRSAAFLAIAVGCVTVDPRFVRYPDAEVAQVKHVHDYKGKPLCQACHLKDSPALIEPPNGPCLRCHEGQHTPGHDVGSVPTPKRGVTGPIDLPLVDGKVVCHTCHDPHDLKKFRHGLRLDVNALCLRCHKKH